VEQYYQKMGLLKSRYEETFLEPPVMLAKLVGGFFRLPFIAYSNYKYEHDPKYREQMIKIEDEKFNAERTRLKTLRDELNAYVQKDLRAEYPKPQVAQVMSEGEKPAEEVAVQEEWLAEEAEAPGPEIKTPAQGEIPQKEVKAAQQQEKAMSEEIEKTKIKAEKVRIKEEKAKTRAVKAKPVAGQPVAIIVARPLKGFSPLKVHFSSGNSRSANARIIAYEWDFGDGDKSTKPNPVNTYYSSSFEPRIFKATLTVTDSKGGVAATSIEIEVLNK
jgi:hypothetical protein